MSIQALPSPASTPQALNKLLREETIDKIQNLLGIDALQYSPMEADYEAFQMWLVREIQQLHPKDCEYFQSFFCEKKEREGLLRAYFSQHPEGEALLQRVLEHLSPHHHQCLKERLLDDFGFALTAHHELGEAKMSDSYGEEEFKYYIEDPTASIETERNTIYFENIDFQQFSAEDLSVFFSHFPNLIYLGFDDCHFYSFRDDQWKALVEHTPKLKILNMSPEMIAEVGNNNPHLCQWLEQLLHVEIHHDISSLPLSTIEKLFSHLRNIKGLSLGKNTLFSWENAHLQPLSHSFPNLKSLDLGHGSLLPSSPEKWLSLAPLLEQIWFVSLGKSAEEFDEETWKLLFSLTPNLLELNARHFMYPLTKNFHKKIEEMKAKYAHNKNIFIT